MLNRWVGIVCAALMVAANAALFVRDILPGWQGGDPPQVVDLSSGAYPKRQAQVGIFNADGRNIGRSWTSSDLQIDYVYVRSTTMLNPIPLPNGIVTPTVRVDTELRYRQADGVLNELVITLRGLSATFKLQGDLIPPDDFVCKWQWGPQFEGQFVLDAQATRAIGEVIRPFDRLPGLYVGRTWRMQLFDPLSRVIPGLSADEPVGESELIRVTRTEVIEHRGEKVETFVVEGPRMRGWVAPDGRVLVQEVNLPVLGMLTLRDEPFDSDSCREAKQWCPERDPDEPEDSNPPTTKP